MLISGSVRNMVRRWWHLLLLPLWHCVVIVVVVFFFFHVPFCTDVICSSSINKSLLQFAYKKKKINKKKNKLVIKWLTSFHRNFVRKCFGCGSTPPPLLYMLLVVVRFLFCFVFGLYSLVIIITITGPLCKALSLMKWTAVFCIASDHWSRIGHWICTHNKHTYIFIIFQCPQPTHSSPNIFIISLTDGQQNI